MSDTESNQSDILAATLAVANTGVGYVLAALAGYFVNMGIAIGCSVAAAIVFFADHNFGALEILQFHRPFLGRQPKRTPWEVFRLSTYTGITMAVIGSTILGQAFYIHELQKQIMNQSIRTLTSDQKQRLTNSLKLDVTDHY